MSAPSATFPWLVADIGGTNARFGLVCSDDGAVVDVEAMRCADFRTPEDAARAYLDRMAQRHGRALRPAHVALALASPISGDTVRMTNSHWVVSRQNTGRALGTENVHLYNDFEVLALALPRLAPGDLLPIGCEASSIDPTLPMAVIGPGTGLGVAVCVPAGTGWIALPGEGGHVTLSAGDDFESEILACARRTLAHVSAERLLSGTGLPTLYGAVAEVEGQAADPLTAEQVTAGAAAGDALCVRTVQTFCAMLGGFAGNVALTVGARGGVFVTGGVAHQLATWLQQPAFRQRFEAKGRFAAYLAPIATALITAPHVALLGAAQGIASSQRA